MVAPLPILKFYLVQDRTVKVRLTLSERNVFARICMFAEFDAQRACERGASLRPSLGHRVKSSEQASPTVACNNPTRTRARGDRYGVSNRESVTQNITAVHMML